MEPADNRGYLPHVPAVKASGQLARALTVLLTLKPFLEFRMNEVDNSANYANKTVQDAQALIDKVQSDLDEAASFYRANNINPDKVLSACEPFIGMKEKAEIEQLAKADQEAIEQEVQEGMARMNFTSGAASSTAGARKTRAMI